MLKLTGQIITKSIGMDNQILILNKLKQYRGKANAVTYKNLSFLTGIGEREVRQIVSDLVTLGKYPIASTSDAGYYWICSDEEFARAHSELVSRIKKLSKRAKGLRIGYLRSKQEIKPRQLELV